MVQKGRKEFTGYECINVRKQSKATTGEAKSKENHP